MPPTPASTSGSPPPEPLIPPRVGYDTGHDVTRSVSKSAPGASWTPPAKSSPTAWASRRSLPSTTTSAISAWTSNARLPGQLIKPLPQSPPRLLSPRLSNLQPAGPHNSSQLFKKTLPKNPLVCYTSVHVPLRFPLSAFLQHSSFGQCPTYVPASSHNYNALHNFRPSPSPDFLRNTRTTLHNSQFTRQNHVGEKSASQQSVAFPGSVPKKIYVPCVGAHLSGSNWRCSTGRSPAGSRLHHPPKRPNPARPDGARGWRLTRAPAATAGQRLVTTPPSGSSGWSARLAASTRPHPVACAGSWQRASARHRSSPVAGPGRRDPCQPEKETPRSWHREAKHDTSWSTPGFWWTIRVHPSETAIKRAGSWRGLFSKTSASSRRKRPKTLSDCAHAQKGRAP